MFWTFSICSLTESTLQFWNLLDQDLKCWQFPSVIAENKRWDMSRWECRFLRIKKMPEWGTKKKGKGNWNLLCCSITGPFYVERHSILDTQQSRRPLRTLKVMGNIMGCFVFASQISSTHLILICAVVMLYNPFRLPGWLRFHLSHNMILSLVKTVGAVSETVFVLL